MNAYIAGQLLLHEVSLESQADQARQQLGSRAVVVKTPQMSALTMELNSGRKPWGDPRVRQAASMAIDRKEAMQVMTDGAGEVGGMMLPTGRWALPLAELKIDRSFVGRMTESPMDMAIVRTILDLGSNLDLSVVAEGIESAEARDLLEELGCTLAQGYEFGSPMSAGRLTAFLRSLREVDCLQLTA